MKRKYFSALLMGALTIASVSTFTSCKDYDDDISSLQKQIDDLNKIVKEIQSQINAGAILDDVQSTNDGLTIKLTKNGKQETYNITNGKDGAKGDNGAAGQDGTVWKIGENGNWWSSEKGGEWKDTGMPSRGEKGAAEIGRAHV